MEEKTFEIDVFVDEKITCQLFVQEKDMNLSLMEAKGAILEDVSEFVPQDYRFLKPISGNSKIPLATKQEKLVTLRKCLVERNGQFYLYLQSCEEKRSGNFDGKSCSNEQVLKSTETESPDHKVDKPVPSKRAKQTTIESAFKIRTDRPKDPLDSARGRVHLYSSRDIERATDGRKEYYKFWNGKAQELCSDPHFNDYRKQELHGVIDTAWQIQSCEILTAKVEAELQNTSESKPGSHNKTVAKNIKRVKEAKRMADELNLQIRQLKQQWKEKGGKAVKAEIFQKEEKLSDAMTEVKLALDALRKSFKNASKAKSQPAKRSFPGAEVEFEVESNSEDERQEDDDLEIGLDSHEVEELVKEAKESEDDW